MSCTSLVMELIQNLLAFTRMFDIPGLLKSTGSNLSATAGIAPLDSCLICIQLKVSPSLLYEFFMSAALSD